MSHPSIREAIILAGGLGTRLRSQVSDRPKPMALVAGMPFLAWLLRYLKGQGVRRAILSVGYKREVIADYFGSSWQGVEIRYAVEEEPLGTGGGMKLAMQQAEEDRVLALNGDTFVGVVPSRMAEALEARPDSRMAMALRRVESSDRYGSVDVADGVVRGFDAAGCAGPSLINAGVYCLPRGVFSSFELGERFSFEKDLMQPMVAQLRPAAVISEGPFIDIGVPEAYAASQTLIPEWFCLGPDRLWRDIRSAAPERPTPALFLDRDGVIVEETGYLCDPGQVRVLDGAAELVDRARRLGMLVIEVTNQAGIGYGRYGWPEFCAVENHIRDLLAASGGARLDAAFACPYQKNAVAEYAVDDHPWRKPNPGMLLEAARLLNVDLARSALVGDKTSDLEAARAAGLERAWLVQSGHGRDHVEAARKLEGIRVEVVESCRQIRL